MHVPLLPYNYSRDNFSKLQKEKRRGLISVSSQIGVTETGFIILTKLTRKIGQIYETTVLKTLDMRAKDSGPSLRNGKQIR